MTTRNVAIRVKSEGKAELTRDFRDIGQSGNQAYGQVAAGADKASAAADRQMEKWRKLAAAQKEAQAVAERQARFNQVLGVGAGSGKSAQESASAFEEAWARQGQNRTGMSRGMRQTAIYTASDIVASAASGASGPMIALQQGPQVLQQIALEGGAAGAALLKVALAVGVVGAAVAIGTTAWLAHVDAMNRVDTSARGLGATAGMTVGQIEALVRINSDLADISRGAGREMATAYLNTGRIGGDVLGRLIALTDRYAKTTAQDAGAATKELADALADPAKGIDVLQGKLHFLDDTTYRYIQTLISQNRTSEAQSAILDAMGPKLLRAADNVNILGRAWRNLKADVANGLDAFGKGIDRMLGGGQIEEQIADLIKKREKLEPWLRVNNASAMAEAQRIDAQIKSKTQEWRDRITQGDAARTNQVADDARAAADRANPLPGRIRELQRDRSRIQAGIESGALSPEGLKEARAGLAAVNKEIAAMEAGYKSSGAQASALAKANREGLKDAREAAREAEERARQAKQLLDIQLRLRLDLAKASGDKSGVEEAEREQRIRQITNELEAAGIPIAKARMNAEAQVGAELRGQYDVMLRQLQVSANDNSFVATEKAMQRIAAGKIVFDENADALRSLQRTGETAFDTIADRLAAGRQAWGSWKDTAKDAISDVIGDLIRLIAINPLKNAIFGGMTGYTPLPTLKFFAGGTDFAPGGMAVVGERGPELVNLPRGSQVFSNAESRRMAGGSAIHVSVNAEASVSKAEVEDMVHTGMRLAVREANGNVPGIVNNGIQRRTIG